MKLHQYQRAAARTLRRKGKATDVLAVSVAALGLAGETGEVCDLLKKWIGHGHTFELKDLEKELGDVLWYVAALATLHKLSLTSIARTNIAKLKKRYPNGFSEAASRNRAA